MPGRAALALAAVLALLAPARGTSQDRPSEEELFGAPSEEPPAKAEPPAKPAPSPAAPETSQRPEESQLFGAPPAAQAAPPPPRGIVSREREDALKIGGQLYLRAVSTAFQGQEPADWSLSSPSLLDVYLDARPNDRVRAFVLGRLFYDPTLPSASAAAAPVGALATGGGLAPGTTLGRVPANPNGVLDQLWVNFDMGRRVFVTAGRQHVKWGVGKFWNPTDYLHPVKRDPLAVFDVRTGTTMVKLHLPWEARGWNAYGVAVMEDVAGVPDATNRLGRVGVGGRAEVVLGSMDLGADALAQDGHRPRFGVDVSAGVWDLDLYAEAALRTSVDTPRWRVRPGADPGVFASYERHDPIGQTAQATVGGSWSVKYSDEDVVTFGAEYFYDGSGYTSPSIYPVLLGVAFEPALLGTTAAAQPNPFTPFYLGRHYGGTFVSLPYPGRWNDTTFTLSVLGNLSDKSFVARLDHSVLALTYLRVETYAAGHFGTRQGEFRLGFTLPEAAGALGVPLTIPPTVFEAGVALRVSL